MAERVVMTKAKTKGQKLREKRMGRPCREGVARTKSGRISYARDGEEAPDTLLKSRRSILFGAPMEDAGGSEWGSVVGRLLKSDEITRDQYVALGRYYTLAERYFASIQAPDSLRSKSGGSAMRIPNDDADIETRRNWRNVIREITDAQKVHNGNLFAALQFMVMRDEFHEHMLGDLRIVANVLDRYYRL